MTTAFDTAFMRLLHTKLSAELASRETTLLEGTFNFEDYSHLTGIRKGLLRAQEIALEAEKELITPEPVKRNA